jgi:hypothetical protein
MLSRLEINVSRQELKDSADYLQGYHSGLLVQYYQIPPEDTPWYQGYQDAHEDKVGMSQVELKIREDEIVGEYSGILIQLEETGF